MEVKQVTPSGRILYDATAILDTERAKQHLETLCEVKETMIHADEKRAMVAMRKACQLVCFRLAQELIDAKTYDNQTLFNLGRAAGEISLLDPEQLLLEAVANEVDE